MFMTKLIKLENLGQIGIGTIGFFFTNWVIFRPNLYYSDLPTFVKLNYQIVFSYKV